jgi:hypothetical protein
MDSDNVIPFPIKYHPSKKDTAGQPVRCIVSGRWLQFFQGSCHLEEGEAIFLHVMTEGANGKDRRICELIVTRQELLRAIAAVEPAPKRK